VTPPLRLTAATATGHLSVLRWGAGDPIVLLHPLALAGELWTPIAARLTGGAVYAPDLRGHGHSSWDGRPFSIADMATDLAHALDSLGLSSVHLLGMSMGGSVGLTFAGTHPERVRSLVLADTTAWYGPDAVATWEQRAVKAKQTPRPEQLPFQRDRWFSPDWAAQHPDEVRRVCDIFLRTDSAAHAASSLAMGAMDSRELLPKITAPTLVLVGEHDYATPPDMARVLADTIPEATLRVLPDLRHLSLIERPELAGDIRKHMEVR
jgi:3-oxoadipate enol-lactonase